MIDSSLVETAVLAHQQFKVRQGIPSAAHLSKWRMIFLRLEKMFWQSRGVVEAGLSLVRLNKMKYSPSGLSGLNTVLQPTFGAF